MKPLHRLFSAFTVSVLVTGCSTIHNAIGPDKSQSEMRASVEAPIELTGEKIDFCIKPIVEEPPAPAPLNAKLYFLLDQTVFTPESLAKSEEIYQQVIGWDASKITIVGHTDTAASNEYNDALSQRRAEKVMNDLIERGVSKDIMDISSHGEYRLEVETPDNTVEVRNRRVEIHAE